MCLCILRILFEFICLNARLSEIFILTSVLLSVFGDSLDNIDIGQCMELVEWPGLFFGHDLSLNPVV